MKTFKVLPTDHRFQSLTEEQLDFIYYMSLQDNKELKDSIRHKNNKGTGEPETYSDPEFDEYWNSHEPEEDDISDWEEVD